LFFLLNPINHARTRADVHRYKVEPYVVAADVYATPPHAGYGGWTWYTGPASSGSSGSVCRERRCSWIHAYRKIGRASESHSDTTPPTTTYEWRIHVA